MIFLKYVVNDVKKMRDFLFDEVDFDDVFYLLDNFLKINGVLICLICFCLELVLEDEVKKLFLKIGDNFWFFFSGYGYRENNNIDYLIFIDGYLNVERSGIFVDYII